ncbi:MAG: WD40 repeat domain-containing protein [Acidimicrobiia bacterium]
MSVSNDGAQANGASTDSAISGDGHFTAFVSRASNLVSGDTNNAADVFVRDRVTNATTRVDLNTNGRQANQGAVSGSLAFSGGTVSLSDDGRFVGFVTAATNLGGLPAGSGGGPWAYVRNRSTPRTTLVSRSPDGAPISASTLAMSHNGRYFAFTAADSGFETYLRDRIAGTTLHVANFVTPSAVSDDGRYVAVTNVCQTGCHDPGTGVLDVTTGATVFSSGQPAGGPFNESGDASEHITLSPDARFIAYSHHPFCFFAANQLACEQHPMGVAIFDRTTNTRVDVGKTPWVGNADYRSLSLSADGSRLAFTGFALTSTNPGAYLWDRATNATLRLDTDHELHVGNVPGDQTAISRDGQWFVFASTASNLVPNDTNGAADVFERNLNPNS